MKKIFALIMAAGVAAMMVSCEIVERDIKPLGHTELSDYAGKLFSNSVLLPVELADLAIEIDEYLALTEEQRREDNRFTVRVISDYVYQFSTKDMSCTVDTGGYSVWEDGAEWKFLSFIATIKTFVYREGAWRTSLTDEVYLTFNADTMGEDMLMVQVEMPAGNALMALESREEGINSWNMSVDGADYGTDGLRSEYNTGYDTGGINVTSEKVSRPDDNGEMQPANQKVCEGIFNVDIYEGSTQVDWVKVYLRYGKSAEYHTSR